MDLALLLVTSSFLVFIENVFSQDKKALKCAACKALVSEIDYAIKAVDPNKRLEIESFRVDPLGNQKTKSVPYARSETHLTEILESVCDEMKNYAKSQDKKTGEITYVRTDSRDGKPVTLENVSLNASESEKLQQACQSILDEYDEDMVVFFKKEDQDPQEVFCADALHFCEKRDDDEEEEEGPEDKSKRNEL